MVPRRNRRHLVAHTGPSRYIDSHPVIVASARRHGVTDADILNAWSNAVALIGEQDDGLDLIIGPDLAGNLLEVGFAEALELPGAFVVVHAMPARPKYLKEVHRWAE